MGWVGVGGGGRRGGRPISKLHFGQRIQVFKNLFLPGPLSYYREHV